MLEWIEAHPGLAAWVQAIGAILAIGAGFLVVLVQQQLERKADDKEKRQRATALAILLQPEIVGFRGAMERATHTGVLESTALEIPGSIVKYADQLYVLGGAGLDLLQMMGAVNVVVAQKMDFHASDRTGNPLREPVNSNLSANLSVAITACDAAIAGLDPLIRDGSELK
jgi:hypothetical protein